MRSIPIDFLLAPDASSARKIKILLSQEAPGLYRMAGTWAAKAIETENFDILMEYDREWRDLFGHTLVRAHKKRRLMEEEWDRFHQIIKSCWIGFREYYKGGSPL